MGVSHNASEIKEGSPFSTIWKTFKLNDYKVTPAEADGPLNKNETSFDQNHNGAKLESAKPPSLLTPVTSSGVPKTTLGFNNLPQRLINSLKDFYLRLRFSTM